MAPNTKSVDPKINTQVWLCYMKTTITIKIKKEEGADDRYLSEPENAHPTGEFVIVAKFGGHVLPRHLVSRFANVMREEGRQTKNLVFAIFKKNLYLRFYKCCTVLCTIVGFSEG